MLSEYIRNLADVSFHVVASMYVRFRYSGKKPDAVCGFFSVFLCSFAVFRPPLRPPLKTEKVKSAYEPSGPSSRSLSLSLWQEAIRSISTQLELGTHRID